MDEIPCDSYFEKGSYTPNPRIQSAKSYIRDLYSQVELNRRRSVRDTVYGVRVLPKLMIEKRLKNLFHSSFERRILAVPALTPLRTCPGAPDRAPPIAHPVAPGRSIAAPATAPGGRPSPPDRSTSALSIAHHPHHTAGKATPTRSACGRRRPYRTSSGRPSSLMYVIEARADRQSTERPPPGAVDVDSTCSPGPRRPYPAMARLAPPLAHHPDASQPCLPYIPTH